MKLSIIIQSATLFVLFTAVRGRTKRLDPIPVSALDDIAPPIPRVSSVIQNNLDYQIGTVAKQNTKVNQMNARAYAAAQHSNIEDRRSILAGKAVEVEDKPPQQHKGASKVLLNLNDQVEYYYMLDGERKQKRDTMNTIRGKMKYPNLYVSGAGIDSYNGMYTRYPTPLKVLRYWVNQNGHILGYNTESKTYVLGPYTKGRGRLYSKTKKMKDGKLVFKKAAEWTVNHEKFGSGVPKITRLTKEDETGNWIHDGVSLGKFKLAPTWYCDCRTCGCGWAGYAADCPKCDKKTQVKKPENDFKTEKMPHGICNVCFEQINDGKVLHAKVCVECDWDVCKACFQKQTQAKDAE